MMFVLAKGVFVTLILNYIPENGLMDRLPVGNKRQ